MSHAFDAAGAAPSPATLPGARALAERFATDAGSSVADHTLQRHDGYACLMATLSCPVVFVRAATSR